ncbi:PIN domain-containing protein [Marinilabilia salmonicolor]|uniref:PIN domain-containing protein n=1 Tax=Marinilabilia salmonicolor TaxID=989 RepID=UPI00029A696E|nr:PIN domain-containing protein [Marinilabilia salmonicolor]
MLKTRNIFIDTQAFVANNFFENKNLRRLAEFGNKETINIYLTEITINEIKSNIKEELLNAQNEINQFKKSISGKSKILKNVPEFKQYIDLPPLNIKVDFNKLTKELDEFIKDGKVSIIPYDTANLEDIITKYFNKEKPFGTGKKKYEFPDAIVLSAIEHWCLKNKCQIYIVGNDKDMSEYVSEMLLPIQKLRTILDFLNKFENERTVWITGLFKKSEEQIRQKLSESFKAKIYDKFFNEINVKSIDIEDFIFHEESIVQDNIDTGETIFQFEFDIYFSTTIEYEHFYESSIDYDDENDKWPFNKYRTLMISMSKTEIAEIAIEADYEQFQKNGQTESSVFCSYISIPNEDDFIKALR